MKNLILFLIAVLVFSCQPKAPEKFEVFRGTNIAHWLSQSRTRGVDRELFFTKPMLNLCGLTLRNRKNFTICGAIFPKRFRNIQIRWLLMN